MNQPGYSDDPSGTSHVPGSHREGAVIARLTGADAAPDREDFDNLARQLFLAHPLPMWVCDVETLGIVEVNGAAVGPYGYPRSEFLAMRVTDIRPPEDIQQLQAHIAAIEPTSTSIQRPTRIWRHLY